VTHTRIDGAGAFGRRASVRPAAARAARDRPFGAGWETDEGAPVRDWALDEPGFYEVVDELRRLLRRGSERKGLVALLTILVLGAVVARQATNVRRYPAHVVLGVTENPRIEEGPVQTSNELKAYVAYAVFTDAALTRVLKKNHYREQKLDQNPRLVLESFREDVEVDVSKNEFAAPRTPGVTRSALVSIELWLPDPEQAISIVRDLGDLVVARDEENNAERLRIERGLATDALSLARTDMDRLWRDRVSASHEIEDAGPLRTAELKVKLDDLDRALVGAKMRLDDAEKARRKLDFAEAASEGSVSLRWDRVDWGNAALKVDERIAVVEVAIAGLLVLFPLMMLGVGAFNPTVYDDRDVRWLGLRALGVVRTNRPLDSSET
jgi:hypothetical protein